MKTVFIVIDHLGTGGAQQQVLEYLKFADRSRYAFKVISLDADKNYLRSRVEALGVAVIVIPHHGFFNPGTLVRLTRLFCEEKPDIVQTYLFTSDTYGRLAARLAGVKGVICSIRNTDLWKKAHHIWVDRVLARWTDVITINADNMRGFLVDTEKLDGRKIRRIYNGLDLSRFADLRPADETRRRMGVPSEAMVIGMVGRFSDQKDYDTFFAAAREVIRHRDDVYVLAVGDGDRLEDFRRKAKQFPDGHRFILPGRVENTPEVIEMFDIGVLATHYEGCPNVLLEYMVCAKPAVATNVGGCPELIVDGETGLLVPDSSPEALAEKLLVLICDPGLRRRMGVHGRRRVEQHFTSQIMARNTERVYQEILGDKPPCLF